jgi:hypothetical protein
MELWMIATVVGVLIVLFVVVSIRQARSEEMKRGDQASSSQEAPH